MNTKKKNLVLAGKMLLLGGISGYIISSSISGGFSFFKGDWGIPIIVRVLAIIGTLIGMVIGTILSSIGCLIVQHDPKFGIIIGAIAGFGFTMSTWYTACWLRGVPICLNQ